MKLINRILVATDFSNTSDNVVENAIDLAKTFKSKIGLIYVLPTTIKNKKANDLLKDFASKQLNIINEKIRKKGVDTLDPFLECGDFSEKIVAISEKINANIILVGAGEKLENNVFQLGSNAKKIIKKSKKPVFVVKNEKPLGIKKILCPVDFSPESKRALKNAITMCRRFEAELTILSVYEIAHLFSISNKINIDEQIEYLREDCQTELDSFLKEFTLTGLKVTAEIKKGDPATVILKTLKSNNYDLLIIGTTGKSGIISMLMGSVTEKVIQEIPTSFITLKNEDIITLEIDSKIRDIESLFKEAELLFKNGFFKEAIDEYNKCINISFMHMPSLLGLSKVYEKLGDSINEKKYKAMVTEISNKMYHKKIEDEIRKFRN